MAGHEQYNHAQKLLPSAGTQLDSFLDKPLFFTHAPTEIHPITQLSIHISANNQDGFDLGVAQFSY
jgi:hypothetical protein